jgi:nondiscriminating glutamyl-tRNA synthetase
MSATRRGPTTLENRNFNDRPPMTRVRTRFAPSPTGSLHLGNVRIAVFNWLFARHHGGDFVIRMEDTDVERNVAGAEEGILEDLRWLGLEWDEGPDREGPYGPYRQSERGSLYREAAERLLGEGKAYPCFCPAEEPQGTREEAGAARSLRCPGRCRDLSAAERTAREADGTVPVLRFAVPEGAIEIVDEVRGAIQFPPNDFGDFVILRGDGRPTYNFAVVVDDIHMEISHVLRGVGHLSNTPKQVVLFDALGRPRPSFTHLPTVLGPDRKKLSKREGSAAVSELRAKGYHPAGVVNYLSLLGWSAGDDEEVLPVDELVRRISLERLGSSDTIYDPEKLRWMSGRHIASMELDDLVAAVEPWLDRERYPLRGASLATAVAAIRSHLTTFGEINTHLAPFFPRDGVALEDARREVRSDPDSAAVVEAVHSALAACDPWEEEALGRVVRAVGKEIGAKGPALFHPVRKALSGESSGPELGKVLEALGREEVLTRLRSTIGPTTV